MIGILEASSFNADIDASVSLGLYSHAVEKEQTIVRNRLQNAVNPDSELFDRARRIFERGRLDTSSEVWGGDYA